LISSGYGNEQHVAIRDKTYRYGSTTVSKDEKWTNIVKWKRKGEKDKVSVTQGTTYCILFIILY